MHCICYDKNCWSKYLIMPQPPLKDFFFIASPSKQAKIQQKQDELQKQQQQQQQQQ